MTLHSLGSADAVPIDEQKRGAIEQGFLDVAFHFLVRRDGHIERGRPLAWSSMLDDDLPLERWMRCVSVVLVDGETLSDEQATLVKGLMEDFEVLDRRD